MATVEELKAIIVDLKMSLAQSKVHNGLRPYSVLDGVIDPREYFGYAYCHSRNCAACKDHLWKKLRKERKEYEEEVATL